VGADRAHDVAGVFRMDATEEGTPAKIAVRIRMADR
jgi:hypothetical protein